MSWPNTWPCYLFEASAEPLKHSLHVATLLHRDDAGVVLLINPYQEVLFIVVPLEFKNKDPRSQTCSWPWKSTFLRRFQT